MRKMYFADDRVSSLTASDAIAAIRSKRLGIVEWAEACLSRIDALEPTLGAWTYLDRERVLDQARQIETAYQRRADIGPLHGALVGLKDIINTADMPTEMGSPAWRGFTPGNNARIVDRLRWRGAVIAGKTVTAEFAVHHPGRTVNPYDPAHTPGTSSSGSAVAVATGMVPMAVGTQTLGSLLRPASYCGVYAFKPTFGTIPRTGILKTTDSLDQVGFYVRGPADVRLFFDALRVSGPNHPYSEQMTAFDTDARPHRVVFVRTPAYDAAHDYARSSIERFVADLSHTGIEVIENELPAAFNSSWEIHQTIYFKCLSYYFAEEYQAKPELVSATMKSLIEQGRAISTADYRRALAAQASLRTELVSFFDRLNADVIVTLSAAGEAPVGLATPNDKDSILIWTLCGAPALNVPLFSGPRKMPFGAQLVAAPYRDFRLLRFLELLADRGMMPHAPYPALPA